MARSRIAAAGPSARWTDRLAFEGVLQPRRKSGFTLLEFEICLVILALGVLGTARLVVDHSRMVADLEEWRVRNPVYYAVKADDDLERACGRAARLSVDAPLPIAESPTDTAYSIELESIVRRLYPPSATVTVLMVPNDS